VMKKDGQKYIEEKMKSENYFEKEFCEVLQ
jgi:hypothetical protein